MHEKSSMLDEMEPNEEEIETEEVPSMDGSNVEDGEQFDTTETTEGDLTAKFNAK